jgi:phosphatidate cytidylyltransferase
VGPNTIRRVVTALIGVPLLVWLVGWGRPWHFSLFIFGVALISLGEYFRLAFPGRRREQALGIVSGAIVAAAMLVPLAAHPSAWFAGVVVAVCSISLFLGGKLEERYRGLGWTLLGVLYTGYLIPHAALLFRLSAGREWVFFVLIVIMAGDTGGYFVGSLLGKNKLCPEISPGKTVEGAIGYATASVVAGLAAAAWLLPAQLRTETIVLSLVLSALGQVGDLFESWIKRVFGVKDSSALLPGHGGLLDRMDSLIFPFVFASHYVRIVQP